MTNTDTRKATRGLTLRTGEVKRALRRQWEVFPLLGAFAAWYATNLSGGLFVDEVAYAETGWAFFHGAPYSNPTHIFAPTGKYFIGIGQLLFGTTTLGVRLPVLISGVLALYLTYRLGRMLRGRVVGFTATLLVGVTPVFARHSVMGMLDVPLALFTVALFYAAARWLRDGSPRDAVAVGVLAVAVVTTKAYAFFYVLPVLVATLAVAVSRSRSGSRSLVDTLKHPAGGAIVTLLVLYSPFFVFPHPPVPEGYLPTAFGGVLPKVMALPVVGNLLYVFGAAMYVNFGHLGGGHAVEVGTAVYQYPPAWAYLYWLYEAGLVYLLALALTVASTVRYVANRDVGWPLLVNSGVLVPLIGLSVMSVKFPRYMLPVFPLLAVVGVAYGYRVVQAVVARVAVSRSGPTPTWVAGAFLIVMASVSVVPPSPLVTSVEESIRTDSGFDQVAEFVAGCDVESSSDEMVVLAYHRSALEYYSPPRDDVVYLGYTPTNAANDTHYQAIHDQLEAGEIDLVVTIEDNQRIRELQPALYQYIRTSGERQLAVPQSPEGQLVVYRFSDVSCREQ